MPMAASSNLAANLQRVAALASSAGERSGDSDQRDRQIPDARIALRSSRLRPRSMAYRRREPRD